MVGTLGAIALGGSMFLLQFAAIGWPDFRGRHVKRR
jgi:hypothetical protein